MINRKTAAAFNEWMRRYTETPAEYEREFESVGQFLTEQANGEEPSYGMRCAGYLEQLMGEVATEEDGPDAIDGEKGGVLSVALASDRLVVGPTEAAAIAARLEITGAVAVEVSAR